MNSRTAIILIVSLIVLVGVGYLVATEVLNEDSSEDSDNDQTSTTPEAGATLDVRADMTPTEEITPNIPPTEEAGPDRAVTEVPTADGELRSSDSGYVLAVSYAVDNSENGDAPAPPAGYRWVTVVANLINVEGQPVDVSVDSLALVDQDNNRYTPEPPAENEGAPLVGSTLAQDATLYGTVTFVLPQDANPALLEWCPVAGCSQPLQSSIP
jgi:hypothetical protein